jgi:hypothetical protein
MDAIQGDDSATTETQEDALNMVRTAYENANSVDELIDLDREAYKNARNLILGEAADVDITDRLDTVRSFLQ